MEGRCAATRLGSEQAEEPAAALALCRLRAAGDEGVRRVVPLALRIVVPENGGGALRLVVEAERVIALDHAMKRFRNMALGLDIVHDGLETVDRSKILALAFIPPAELH